jgi:hypothetical protein
MRRNGTIYRFARLCLIEHNAFSAIERILSQPIPLERYCISNAKARPTHQFGQGSDPGAAHLDAVTPLEACVAVAIGGVDYCRVLLWLEIAGRPLNDFNSSQPKRGILKYPSRAEAKIEEADQAGLLLAARQWRIFPGFPKLPERVEIHLNKKPVTLCGRTKKQTAFQR